MAIQTRTSLLPKRDERPRRTRPQKPGPPLLSGCILDNIACAGLFPASMHGGLISNPEASSAHASPRRLQGNLAQADSQGRPDVIPLSERAISEYWDATLEKGRKSGLRLIQMDVLEQRNAVTGTQHNFAQTVNEYIEKKLRGE